jgi:hypothetical protein
MSRFPKPYVKHLSLDGADSVFYANVDGSGTPQLFEARPASPVVVARLLVVVGDNANLTPEDYGGVAGPLANGITIQKVQGVGAGADVVDELTDLPIQRLVDWTSYSYDGSVDDFGSGDNYYRVRWSFNKFDGQGIYLRPDKQEALRISIRDNLSGLTLHRFTAEGFYLFDQQSDD